MHKGQHAPDFELPDQHGKPAALGDLLGRGALVLFFYPMALSGGCTEELNHFKALEPEFTRAGAHLAGVSRDSIERQKEFAHRAGVTFPLLSDTDERVSEAYGVKRRFLAKALPVKRSSFVIDSGGMIVDVISGETDMKKHADRTLSVVKALSGGTRTRN